MDPLLAMPNVVATPHVANMTMETIETIARAAADNIRRVREGLPPMHQILKSLDSGPVRARPAIGNS
jgi:phosphoglycerate dehydrogenase-like enzyme